MFWGWTGLIVFLCISTFGFTTCLTSLIAFLLFLIGGLSLSYIKQTENCKSHEFQESDKNEKIIMGMYQVVDLLQQPAPDLKTDRRLTGSQVIDDQLQDILNFVIRDYVYPWYDVLSSDEEFPHQVRVAVQKTIISFASRMKEVDWIPYLTTRLVDDAASHLRLFRQARAKMKHQKQATAPTLGEHKRVPSGEHRRIPSGGKMEFKPPPDLETVFFDLEFTMEEYQLCRDHICLDSENEKTFLRQISQVLLFLLTSEDDFHCLSLRYFTQELLVNSVLLPIIDLISDPDYVNQIIIWLCKDIPVTSEVFLSTLRGTDNLEELFATKDLVNKEFSVLRSKDSGGEDDTWVKQQLSSLAYVGRLIESRITRLQEGAVNDSTDTPSSVDYSRILSSGTKLFSLPLDVILKNNIALSYFIDYMTSISAHSYLFFYLNVEGWRVSVEQQMSDLALQRLKQSDDSIEKAVDAAKLIDDQISTEEQTLERMREAAYSIFDQYLSEKASPRLRLDESLVKRLLLRIRTEVPSELWFDEVQSAVYEKLQTEEKFLNGFRGSVGYVKLLTELELLKETGSKSDDEDTASTDELSIGSETASLSSLSLDATREGSLEGDSISISVPATSVTTSSSPNHTAVATSDCKSGPFTLHAEILETGVVHEKGKTFGIYALSVTKKYDSGYRDTWHIYRRYSDFYELHQKVREKYTDLSRLTFPGKKTFHNMDRRVLERRMKMLNDYLQTILQNSILISHPNLRNLLLSFFEPGEYDKGLTGGQLTRTLDSLLVNPLRAVSQSMGQTVRTLPDNLISTVDGVMDGLNKVLQISGVKGQVRQDSDDGEAIKVGASLDIEMTTFLSRIMLLLMTEVFELKSRNQWLRRRIVTLLRQIVRTMFGDIVNRRIIDYVFAMTSPSQVADYLRTLKHSYWPHGLRAEPKMPRDEAIRARTRVAAKLALLSCLSDEFKHILGIETSRRGLLSVFSLFQHRVLNRRLLYVLLEGILCTLFSQDHPLDAIFTRLHSRSPRVIKNLMHRSRR